MQQPLPGLNQRWREGRPSYRPAGEAINLSEHDVAPLATDREARAFCAAHHYSGERSYPAARRRFGLYHRGELAGVAVFSYPMNDRVFEAAFPSLSSPLDALELGRFVLLNEVPGNGETFFLGRCRDYLRKEGFAGVVTFSDPVPRTRADGEIVFPGHYGSIYCAHSAVYLGRSTARTLRLLPDGTVLSDRSIQKCRAGSRGWAGAAQSLERFGADPCPSGSMERKAWLTHWVAALTRPQRHPGNHRYAWPLSRAVRKSMPNSLPYPKGVCGF